MRNASGRRESKTRRIRDALLEEKRGSLGYGAGETAHLDSGGAPAPAADGEAWKVPGEKETAEEQTPSAMTCPWCGQEMRMGYLVGGRDAVRLVWERPGAFRLADADGTLYLRGDGSFWSDYKLAWHCGACRKLVLDTANCTRAELLTSEEINRRIIYGADAEHLSESREEE